MLKEQQCSLAYESRVCACRTIFNFRAIYHKDVLFLEKLFEGYNKHKTQSKEIGWENYVLLDLYRNQCFVCETGLLRGC